MLLGGAPCAPRDPAEAIAAGVVMAGEDRHRSTLMPAGWPGEAVRATISLPHLHRWFPSGFVAGHRETAEGARAISRLGIRASSPGASVWSLSGSNQQKTVIARWEAEPSRVLLLDEPFQGVDLGARQDTRGRRASRSSTCAIRESRKRSPSLRHRPTPGTSTFRRTTTSCWSSMRSTCSPTSTWPWTKRPPARHRWATPSPTPRAGRRGPPG